MVLFIVTEASGEQNFLSFLFRTLQHIIEKHCHMQHIPIALTLVSAYEYLNIVENTFRSEFLFNNLIICCGTENF